MEPNPLTARRVGLQEKWFASGRRAGDHLGEGACTGPMAAVRRGAPYIPDILAPRLSG